MAGASRALTEQRLDDCRADRHDERRFDEKTERASFTNLPPEDASFI
jgi:hypothetical protein